MPNNVIFEDQENQIPIGARKQNFKSDISNGGLRTSNNVSNVNNSKRTVLGALNVSNNVRVQPHRTAKQVN